jgi:alpha-L-fucosidase 2
MQRHALFIPLFTLALAATLHAAKPVEPEFTESATLTNPLPFPQTPLTLWYQQPAKMWTEALPVGNGHLGAMVFGGVASERLQLNEDTLWEGYPHDPNNPDALKNLPTIRQLLFDGKSAEATKLIGDTMMGIPPRIRSYQPLGDLQIDAYDIAKGASVTNYRRSLDLATGIATTQYTADGTTFTSEVFASHPDDVVVVHLTADHPGKINVILSLSRSQDATFSDDATTALPFISITGQIQSQYADTAKKQWGPEKPGMRFAGRMAIIRSGGGLSGDMGSTLHTLNADSLTLLVAAHTDYQHDGTFDRALNLAALCQADLDNAAKKSYDQLKADHLADIHSYMNRVSLDLGTTAPEIAKLPTDERLKHLSAASSGGIAADPDLLATYFQLGRYMLLSSSRPGGMPANLQGLWSKDMNAPWNSDYHTNINIQMNYWPAEVTNLSECTAPLFDLMDHLVTPGEKTAQVEYGAHGWVVHHLTDPFLTTTPCDGPPGVWPMGAAWMCQHAWEHYAFTNDRDFLEHRAYPLMKGAAQFILDILIPAPANTPVAGKLVTNPSYSPENKFITSDGKVGMFSYGSTMDLEIIHDLLTHTIAASKILNTDDAFRTACETALANLAPLQISKQTGRLQEWVEDYKEQDPHHRHTSHLFAVYPGDQISLSTTPDLAAAAEKSLAARTDTGATEWSLAWRTALWARFHDAEHAYGELDVLLAKNLFPNLFNRYSGQTFQIDGNLGATAAIAEMLLQSQSTQLQFLPALPKEWPTGHVTGLKARGGFTVDISWKDGKLTEATLNYPPTAPDSLDYTINAGAVKTIQLQRGGGSLTITPTGVKTF